MKTSSLKVTMLLLCSTMLIGCATIMGNSGPEALNVRTSPDQATVVITDEEGTKIFEGKTPTTIPLEKRKGYFSGKTYRVTISKSNFEEQEIAVDTRANGWYVGGNILFGGLVGWLIVDPATGAMWTLDTNEINVNLSETTKQGSILDPTKSGIVLLDDVPSFLRDKMVVVAKQ